MRFYLPSWLRTRNSVSGLVHPFVGLAVRWSVHDNRVEKCESAHLWCCKYMIVIVYEWALGGGKCRWGLDVPAHQSATTLWPRVTLVLNLSYRPMTANSLGSAVEKLEDWCPATRLCWRHRRRTTSVVSSRVITTRMTTTTTMRHRSKIDSRPDRRD